MLGGALLLLERHTESQAVMRRGLRIARAEQIDHIAAPLTTLLAMGLTETLDLPECLQRVEAAEETARLQGLTYQLQWALWCRFFAASLQGDVQEVRRLEAECRPLLDDLHEGDIFKSLGRCNLAVPHADEDPALAMREMVAAAGIELDGIDPRRSLWLALVLVRAAIACGDLAEAHRIAELIERRAITYELPVGVTRALAAPRSRSPKATSSAPRGSPGRRPRSRIARRAAGCPLDTAEHHLSRAYAKLGVRSRTELTATWYGGDRDLSMHRA